MIARTAPPIQIRGRQYPCYCKVPASELFALTERERARAWSHILQHTAKE
jgi:hypothetical protein